MNKVGSNSYYLFQYIWTENVFIARRLWLDFYCGGGIDGVVFFVDASDPEKMKSVKIELDVRYFIT
jgi:hypothetical protein